MAMSSQNPTSLSDELELGTSAALMASISQRLRIGFGTPLHVEWSCFCRIQGFIPVDGNTGGGVALLASPSPKGATRFVAFANVERQSVFCTLPLSNVITCAKSASSLALCFVAGEAALYYFLLTNISSAALDELHRILVTFPVPVQVPLFSPATVESPSSFRNAALGHLLAEKYVTYKEETDFVNARASTALRELCLHPRLGRQVHSTYRVKCKAKHHDASSPPDVRPRLVFAMARGMLLLKFEKDEATLRLFWPWTNISQVILDLKKSGDCVVMTADGMAVTLSFEDSNKRTLFSTTVAELCKKFFVTLTTKIGDTTEETWKDYATLARRTVHPTPEGLLRQQSSAVFVPEESGVCELERLAFLLQNHTELMIFSLATVIPLEQTRPLAKGILSHFSSLPAPNGVDMHPLKYLVAGALRIELHLVSGGYLQRVASPFVYSTLTGQIVKQYVLPGVATSVKAAVSITRKQRGRSGTITVAALEATVNPPVDDTPPPAETPQQAPAPAQRARGKSVVLNLPSMIRLIVAQPHSEQVVFLMTESAAAGCFKPVASMVIHNIIKVQLVSVFRVEAEMPDNSSSVWQPLFNWLETAVQSPKEHGNYSLARNSLRSLLFHVTGLPQNHTQSNPPITISPDEYPSHPLRFLEPLFRQHLPEILSTVLDGAAAADYVDMMEKRFARAGGSSVQKKNVDTQTIRTSRQEEFLLQECTALRAQKLYDQENRLRPNESGDFSPVSKKQQRGASPHSPMGLTDSPTAREKQLQEMLLKAENLIKEKEDSLHAKTVAAAESAAHIVQLLQENTNLREQLTMQSQHHVGVAIHNASKQLFTQSAGALQLMEVTERERLTFAESKSRFELVTTLLLPFINC